MSTQYAERQLADMFKVAGDAQGSDQAFAQAFSNIAHAYFREKAPSLLEYEQGFQLLDRDENPDKAIGVVAFMIGKQPVFAPVFFLRGQLKGHELMYLKDQDMFVPLNEGWLQHIINRRPQVIGRTYDKERLRGSMRQPDIERLRFPRFKHASAFMPVVGHLVKTSARQEINAFLQHCREQLNLEHFVKQASLPALRRLVHVFRQQPKLAAAFDRWHGFSVLHDAIRDAKSRLESRPSLLDKQAVNRNQLATGSLLENMAKQAAIEIRQQVTIITASEDLKGGFPKNLSDADKGKLLRDGVLIRDNRSDDNTSVALRLETEKRLQNPTQTGVYDVLVKPGTFEQCLVVAAPKSDTGNGTYCTVVRLNNSRNWANFRRANVFLVDNEEPENDWDSWLSQQSSAEPKKGRRYVAVGPRRQATAPFYVYEKRGDNLYDVSFSTLGDGPCCISMSEDDSENQTRLYTNQPEGTAFRTLKRSVYLPKSFKLVEIEEATEDADDSCCGPWPTGAASGKSLPIIPGDISEVTMGLFGKTAALKVAADGLGGYLLNEHRVKSRNDAIIGLVSWAGLREKQSRFLVDEADDRFRRKQAASEYRVKIAEPYMLRTGVSAPAFPDFQTNAYNPMSFAGSTDPSFAQETVVPELMAGNTDPGIYDNSPYTGQNTTAAYSGFSSADQGADMGQQELFDTSMIGGMLRAVRDDTLIDRYLPDLVKGMDRLGRILFMFYWHNDRFEDRYGKQDLPELEDALRNSFEMLGETVLSLQQKTIEPYPEEGTGAAGIDRIASI